MYTMNTTKAKKQTAKTEDKPITGKVIAGHTFYSVAEIASVLQITTVSVRKYIKTGKMKGQRIGYSYYVSEKALADFLGV
jgi:excisionase family DNA binding protein